jgi:hypothetical protein
MVIISIGFDNFCPAIGDCQFSVGRLHQAQASAGFSLAIQESLTHKSKISRVIEEYLGVVRFIAF